MWKLAIGWLGLAVTLIAQTNVDFVAQVDLASIGGGSTQAYGVWGLRTPDGREYALICTDATTAVYDLDDPFNPTLVGQIAGSAASWRDVQVYVFQEDPFAAYAYVASSAGDLQIIDLSLVPASISELSFSYCPGGFSINTAERIFLGLKPSGFIAYVIGEDNAMTHAVHVLDVSSPGTPCNLGMWVPPGPGTARDMVLGSSWADTRFDGLEIGIVFAGDTFHVVDFSDFYSAGNTPALIHTYAGVGDGFEDSHGGWIDEEGRYLYALDRGDEIGPPTQNTSLKVYDLEVLDDVELVHTWNGPTMATDWHGLISGNYLYLSNGSAGLRLFPLLDPLNLNPFAQYDSFPANDDPGAFGAMESYPYPFSGLVALSDRQEGLLILDPLVPEDACREADLEGDGFDPDDLTARTALWLIEEDVPSLLFYFRCL